MAIIDGGAATRRGACLVVAVLLGSGLVVASQPSGAAEAPVGLGTAASFAVLAGAGVTNTGPTIVNGNLGSCPTPAISGFAPTGPGVVNGQIHPNTVEACDAQSALTIAYNDASGRAPNTTYTGPTELGARPPLVAGVYKSPTSFAITGTLSLDAQNDPAAVFIFQAGSTLDTAVDSRVLLLNGAQACNVFWQVGSSATLDVRTAFAGTILALSSITARTNATVQGRLLARNGAVTLDSNTVSVADCASPPTSTSAVPTTTVGPSTTSVPATTTTTAVPATTTTTAAPATTTTTAPPATTTTTAPPATTTTTAPPAAAISVTTTSLPGATAAAVGATSGGDAAGSGPGATGARVGSTGSAGTASGDATSGTTAAAGGGGSGTSLTGTGSGGTATSMTSGSGGGAGETGTLARTGSGLWSETLVGLLAVGVGLLMLSAAGQGPTNPPWRRPVRPSPWVGPVRPPFLLLNEPWTPEKNRGSAGSRRPPRPAVEDDLGR